MDRILQSTRLVGPLFACLIAIGVALVASSWPYGPEFRIDPSSDPPVAAMVFGALFVAIPSSVLLAPRMLRRPLTSLALLALLAFLGVGVESIVAGQIWTHGQHPDWTLRSETLPGWRSGALAFNRLYLVALIGVAVAGWAFLMLVLQRLGLLDGGGQPVARHHRGIAGVGLVLAVEVALFLGLGPIPAPLGIPAAPTVAVRPSGVSVVQTSTGTSGGAMPACGSHGYEAPFLRIEGPPGTPVCVLGATPQAEGPVWIIDQSSGTFVWDRGDALLFPNGLELPKAPGFTSADRPWQNGPDAVWLPHRARAYFVVDAQGRVTARNLWILPG